MKLKNSGGEIQVILTSDPRFSNWRQQFGMFTDEHHTWRCAGRLEKAELPFSAKHPILLDQRHHFTALVVHEAHWRVKHNRVIN